MSHVFNGEKDGDYVVITGNFDVNIWYSSDNNTNTGVLKDKVDYKEKIKIKMSGDNYDGNDEIIVRSLVQPTCSKAEIIDGKINYSIDQELSAEIVGDAKIRVGINDEEENDEVVDDEPNSDSLEQEISNSVKEDFL